MGKKPGSAVLVFVALLLAGSVLAAVHHAEVVAHRVGEPFGALTLAVAVTVIEVALIVTLMVSGDSESSTLARDTVFAAVMITTNGIVGLSVLVGALHARCDVPRRGPATALATVRDDRDAEPRPAAVHDEHARPGLLTGAARLRGRRLARALRRCSSSSRPCATATTSSPTAADTGRARRAAVRACGAREPRRAARRARRGRRAGEDRVAGDRGRGRGGRRAAVGRGRRDRAAGADARDARRVPQRRRGRVQISLNLAYGSAMASIGLTVPVIAVASIWLEGPLGLGLGPTEIVLLAITVVVGALSAPLGRATLQQSGIHLVLFASFLFLAVFP